LSNLQMKNGRPGATAFETSKGPCWAVFIGAGRYALTSPTYEPPDGAVTESQAS